MVAKLVYEDFPEGSTRDLGHKLVTAEEIIAFASEFDFQPMHLDEAAGKASILGGLAASGWHTCSMMMRMLCDAFINASASEGGPGIDYVRWKRPVLAGDTIGGTATFGENRVSKSRPDIGLIKVSCEIRNQRDEIVLECRYTARIRVKAAA